MAKKKLKKALMLGAALAGGLGLAKARRNKAIDAGIAAADEEPGAQIKNYGPYKKSKVASTPPKIWPNFDMFDEPNFAAAKGGRAMKSKGGRVTGAAKRGFGRALMKGKK